MRFTRRPGESFFVGMNVKVTIDAIKDGRVRISVEAPETITVFGEEVIERLSEAASAAVTEAGTQAAICPPKL